MFLCYAYDVMKTKKIFSISLIISIMAILLVGCSSESANRQGKIAPAVLSGDQQDIISLISSDNQEIILFDFQASEFSSVELWVEVYEYGVLVDSPSGLGLHSDEATEFDGQMAILINQEQGTQNFGWTLIIRNSGGTSRTVGPPSTKIQDGVGLGRAFGPITEPVEIQDGVEIILYASIFSRGSISIFGDKQIYLEQPELLADYPYVHIIKAMFTI